MPGIINGCGSMVYVSTGKDTLSNFPGASGKVQPTIYQETPLLQDIAGTMVRRARDKER